MDQPTAEQALRRLEPLVGEWAVEASWPDGTAWPGGGTVTFEWHESGAHLVERGTVDLAEAPDNLSIIGCDAANGTYFQLYSDERGVCRVYQMSIDEGGGSGATASRSPSASRGRSLGRSRRREVSRPRPPMRRTRSETHAGWFRTTSREMVYGHGWILARRGAPVHCTPQVRKVIADNAYGSKLWRV